MTAVSLAGYVGIGQVLATFADRYGRISVMLVADLSRAALFIAMLLDVPVGGAARARLPGRSRHPALRGGSLGRAPRPRARGGLPGCAGAVRHLRAVLARARLRAGRPAADRRRTPRRRSRSTRCSFLVSAFLLLEAPAQRGRPPGGDAVHGLALARRRRRVALRRPDGASRARVRVGHGCARHRRRGARRPLRRAHRAARRATSASSPRRSRSARWWRRWSSPAAGATTTRSCAPPGGAAPSPPPLAAPLFWFEASGGLAFLAFAISGGMFAVSIPTNTVIGLRLSRDTRASAMGIAVGVLMGSQALGAAVGGIVASAVGSPRAIGGALALAAVFSLWSVATTPADAKHLAVRRRPVRVPSSRSRPSSRSSEPVPAPVPVADTVVDLVAMEAARSRRPGSGEPAGRGVRIPGHALIHRSARRRRPRRRDRRPARWQASPPADRTTTPDAAQATDHHERGPGRRRLRRRRRARARPARSWPRTSP